MRQFRHKIAFRVIASGLLAFCVLSSGRGLVPGMCATLAAAQHEAEKSSCCQTALPDKDNPLSLIDSEEATSCAFCNLAKAFFQTQDYVYCDRPAGAEQDVAVCVRATFRSSEHYQFAQPRDPPCHGYIS